MILCHFIKNFKALAKVNMVLSISEMKEWHKRSRFNALSIKTIESPLLVYCIYCKNAMRPSDIIKYVDEGRTALCSCGVDSLIYESEDSKMTADILSQLHDYYFKPNS